MFQLGAIFPPLVLATHLVVFVILFVRRRKLHFGLLTAAFLFLLLASVGQHLLPPDSASMLVIPRAVGWGLSVPALLLMIRDRHKRRQARLEQG